MAERIERQLSKEHFFTKYRIAARSGRSINLWDEGFKDRGSHSHGGDNGRPAIGGEVQKKIKEMFKAGSRRLL